MTGPDPLRARLHAAEAAAREAGCLLRAGFGRLRPSQIGAKRPGDPVTDLDRRSEILIARAVRRRFPADAILGEEYGARSGGPYCWVIDPLDGTANYIHAIPLFCVSIGILLEGEAAAAIVYDPSRKECFTAIRSGGACLEGRRLAPRWRRTLPGALLSTAIPARANLRAQTYAGGVVRLTEASCSLRRTGSCALDLAWVACGRLDAFWGLSQAPWDTAAGTLLVREAGGRVSQAPTSGREGRADILASACTLHRRLLALLPALGGRSRRA